MSQKQKAYIIFDEYCILSTFEEFLVLGVSLLSLKYLHNVTTLLLLVSLSSLCLIKLKNRGSGALKNQIKNMKKEK